MLILAPPLFFAVKMHELELAMKAQSYVYSALVAVCLCISLVGYYRDGSVPILELALGGVPSSYSEGYPVEVRSLRLPKSHSGGNASRTACSCPPLAVLIDGNTSKKDALTFVSSHTAVETVIPLPQLKKKIRFSQHKGLSYLDHRGLNRYYLCSPATTGAFAKIASSSKQCKERSFLDRKSPVVALVSSPGSGNTWLRLLLEQVTGVYTGSIYCDHSLKALFPGEHIVGGNVLVVKTHRTDNRELPEDIQEALGKRSFDKAVVLVRNVYDALVSEANRRWNSKKYLDSHVGLADETSFVGNSHWDWYVESRGTAWGYMLHTWLAHNHLPVHVVQYERLVTHTREELSEVLQFLESPADNSTLTCALESSESVFKRKKHLNFDPYSKENKELINRVLTQAAPFLAQYGIHYDKR